MGDMTNCEKYVIEKLISILSKTLNCQTDQTISDSEASVVDKVIQILVTQTDLGNEGNDTMEFSPDEGNSNYTDGTSYSDGRADSGISSSASNFDNPLVTNQNKLHKLEIIKVFVLIFVISIILLTTCRMVFQLFIRFRPEKPPLG